MMPPDLSLTLVLLLLTSRLPASPSQCTYATGPGGLKPTDQTPTDLELSWMDLVTGSRGTTRIPLCFVGGTGTCHPYSFDFDPLTRPELNWDATGFADHLATTVSPGARPPTLPKPQLPPKSDKDFSIGDPTRMGIEKAYREKYYALELEFRGIHCRSGTCVVGREAGEFEDPAGLRGEAHCEPSTVSPTFVNYAELQRRMEELRKDRETDQAVIDKIGTEGCSYVKGRKPRNKILSPGINRLKMEVDSPIIYLPVCFMSDRQPCYPKDEDEAADLTEYLRVKTGQVLFLPRDAGNGGRKKGKDKSFVFDPKLRSWLCLSGMCNEHGACGIHRKSFVWNVYERTSLYYYKAGSGRVRGTGLRASVVTSLIFISLT